jgi:hypothetical protein
LPGDAVKRDFSYFGDVGRFAELAAAGFPGYGEGPLLLTDATYNKMTLGFYGEIQAMNRTYDQTPIAFLVRQFNEHTPNETALDAGGANLVPLSDDVAVVTGPGLTTPSDAAVAAAHTAEAETAALYSDHPGPLGNPLHNLRVILGLAILLVVPGAIAARWFELEGPWMRIALVPGISIVLTILAGFIVASVWRGPFSTGHGWASVGLATGAAAGLRYGGEGFRRVLDSFAGFFNKLFGVFSIRDYSVLMGVQFLVQTGQGVIQGAIGKSIAFGGEKGFDVSTVPSADYLLKVVLALYIPYSLVSPFIGVFIDRFQRRKVLAWANVLTAAVVAAVAVGVMLPLGKESSEGNVTATIALIVGLLMIQACVRVALAVKSAAIPDVLSGKDLMQGNALSQAGRRAVPDRRHRRRARRREPAAVVARRRRRLRHPHRRRDRRAAAAARRDRAARQHVRPGGSPRDLHDRGRPEGGLVPSAGGARPAELPDAALPVLGLRAVHVRAVREEPGRGRRRQQRRPGHLGAGGFVGGALGLVLAQKWKDKVPPIRLLLASMFALGAAVLVFGAFVSLAGFAALLFVGFFAFFMGKISADTIMQQAIPDDFRGRAFALFDIAYNLGFIVPAFILSVVWIEGASHGPA